MFHIVLCTYNAQKYLQRQLESIENNSETQWLLHVYDDQSTDNTIELIKEFKKKYSDGKIRININENKKGAWKNFLCGIRDVQNLISEEDYVMLCDQDDIWNPSKIKDTYMGMQLLENQHGKAVPLLVSSDVTLVDAEENILAESYAKRNKFNVAHKDLSHVVMENHVQGCTIMFNKKLADMITDIPRDATMHDVWLNLIATAFGYTGYVREQTMLYRDYEKSVTGHNFTYFEDIKSKFSKLDQQRKIVLEPIPMYKELLRIYGCDMPDKVKDIFESYIGFENNSFFKKRYDIIRLGMWKTGLARNLGLLVLI